MGHLDKDSDYIEDWIRLRKHILVKLDEHETKCLNLAKQYHDLDKELAVIKAKAALIAVGISGALGAAPYMLDKILIP